jgi:hypothetical protein
MTSPKMRVVMDGGSWRRHEMYHTHPLRRLLPQQKRQQNQAHMKKEQLNLRRLYVNFLLSLPLPLMRKPTGTRAVWMRISTRKRRASIAP